MWRIRMYFIVFLVLESAIGWVLGFLVSPKRLFNPWSNMHILFEFIGFLVLVFACMSAGIVLGDPDLGPHRTKVELLSTGWMIFILCCDMAAHIVQPHRMAQCLDCFFRTLLIASTFIAVRGRSLRAVALFSALCAIANPLIRAYQFQRLGCFQLNFLDQVDRCGTGAYTYANALSKIMPEDIHMTFLFLVCSHTKYIRDQRLVVCIFVPQYWAYLITFRTRLLGMYWDIALWQILSFPVFIYANLMFRRRMRYLPPGLAMAKFVRFGYLRKLNAEGRHIQRCQDLPEDAFGDPSKAAHLIVLSHRWLDPLTCDVASERYPNGLKLDRVLCRLDEHFSPVAINDCSLALNHKFLQRIHSAYVLGGWDVLLFFDFMSIPQNGINDDGSPLPRRLQEQVIFDQCIPHMGSLYSIFPVLVLTDVPEGDTDHSYEESGWCTSELFISTLGNRLSLYSSNAVHQCQFPRSIRRTLTGRLGNINREDFIRIKQSIRRDLEAKHFLYESDREIAFGIVEDFLTKRLLADLIEMNTLEEVRELLEEMDGQFRQCVIDAPLDESLKSLLHLAVENRRADIASALLEAGARPTQRNLLGDRPDQWFMFSRCNAAARMCRKYRWRSMYSQLRTDSVDDEDNMSWCTASDGANLREMSSEGEDTPSTGSSVRAPSTFALW